MRLLCVQCCVEKDISMFEWAKNRPNPRKRCKECRYKSRDKRKENENAKERKKLWREQNKERLRESWEKVKYGVHKGDFNYKECWVCGSQDRLCIDHCHTTGKARGLLCTLCNTALGYFKDNTVNMARAIEYLKTGPHFELDRKVYP